MMMVRLPPGKSEHLIAQVLRYGSSASTVIMALGLGLLLLRGNGASLATYQRLRLSMLLPSLIRFDPAALMEFGILLLLLTPLFRIVVALVSFALERDLKYVLVSSGVLGVVLLSICLAIEG
jgi:uncharacterized membrane protein